MLTLSCLDSFGIGILLSFGYWKKPTALSRYKYIGRLAVLLSLLIYVFYRIYFGHEFIISSTLISIVSAFLIFKLINIKDSPIIELAFKSTWIVYLGKISYGLYLYHTVIPFYMKRSLRRWSVDHEFVSVFLLNDLLFFIMNFLILLGIASISYFLIEKPILNLKNKFA